MDIRPTTARTLRAFVPFKVAGALIGRLTRVGRRDPPPSPPERRANGAGKTRHVRLISITASNYVEKVRWSLDLLESHRDSPVYYTEDCHPPALHAFETVPASGDRASQSPMIVTDDDLGALWGSDAILRELCSDPKTVDLYPEPVRGEVRDMEVELGERLGSTARCFGYYHLLDDSKRYYGAAAKFLTLHSPVVERKLFAGMLDRGLAEGMKQVMSVEELGEASGREIRKVFEQLSQRLDSNGGEYLLGAEHGFTAADLSLAALSYFILRPPEMGPLLIDESEMPRELVELGHDLRGTAAGKHALRMYREHRPVVRSSDGTGEILIRRVNQDRLSLTSRL